MASSPSPASSTWKFFFGKEIFYQFFSFCSRHLLQESLMRPFLSSSVSQVLFRTVIFSPKCSVLSHFHRKQISSLLPVHSKSGSSRSALLYAHNISQVCVVCVNVISFFKKILCKANIKKRTLSLSKGFSDFFSHKYSCFHSCL